MNVQSAPAKVRGYELDFPSRQIAFAALGRFLSKEETEILWKKACEDCTIPQDTSSIDQLESIFKYISMQPGVIGVVGKSLNVRIITYRTLSLKQNG